MKTKATHNLLANLPLVASVISLVLLQYNGGSKLLLALLLMAGAAAGLFLSMRVHNVYGFFRQSLRADVVILSLLTLLLFAVRFGVNAVNSSVIWILGDLLHLPPVALAWFCACAGGILSFYCICLFYEYLNQLGKQSIHSPVNRCLTVDALTSLKGVMIVAMVVHHAFGFPEWYLSGTAYPRLTPYVPTIREVTKLCVGTFAVLTGYTYALHKDKSFFYSLRKIGSILKDYSLVWLVILGMALAFGGYRPTVWELVLEWLMVNNRLVTFGWYIYFYILCMLVLPVFILCTEKLERVSAELLGFLIIWGAGYLLNLLLPGDSLALDHMRSFNLYFFCIASGFILGKYALADRFVNWTTQHFPLWVRLCAGILLALAVGWRRTLVDGFFLGTLWVSLDFVYAPLAVTAFLLLYLAKIPALRKCLQVLGKHSLNIWLLHSVFYGLLAPLLQPIAYLPKDPLLVTVWILLLCLGGSLLLYALSRALNRIFRKRTKPEDCKFPFAVL